MNSDIFEGKWKQMMGAAKQKWGKFTDNDWTTMTGKKDELVGKIQERYGVTRDEAQKEADTWAKDFESSAASDVEAGKHAGRQI